MQSRRQTRTWSGWKTAVFELLKSIKSEANFLNKQKTRARGSFKNWLNLYKWYLQIFFYTQRIIKKAIKKAINTASTFKIYRYQGILSLYLLYLFDIKLCKRSYCMSNIIVINTSTSIRLFIPKQMSLYNLAYIKFVIVFYVIPRYTVFVI